MPTVETATISLGDTVEVADPKGNWQGVVCVVDHQTRRANVTTTDGDGASSVRLDSPEVRVVASNKPVRSCDLCQAEEFGMSMLCDTHAV